METVFREKNNVVTSLVADVNQYVYKNAGMYIYAHTNTVQVHTCVHLKSTLCSVIVS